MDIFFLNFESWMIDYLNKQDITEYVDNFIKDHNIRFLNGNSDKLTENSNYFGIVIRQKKYNEHEILNLFKITSNILAVIQISDKPSIWGAEFENSKPYDVTYIYYRKFNISIEDILSIIIEWIKKDHSGSS